MFVMEHNPPEYGDIPDSEPVLFCNGPIQGAQDWQHAAYEIASGLWVATDTLHVANPRQARVTSSGEFTDEEYVQQVTWEDFHRMRAAWFGGHIYWFAAQDHSLPYTEGREYAKTTKKEIIHFKGMLDAFEMLKATDKLNIAVGFDPDYEDSERYIKLFLKKRDIAVHDTLEATVESAIKQIEASYG